MTRYAILRSNNRHYCVLSVANSHLSNCITRTRSLQSAVTDGNLGVLCVDASECLSLAVGKLVHSLLGEVEAVGGVVNGKNVDGLAVVCDAVASTALMNVISMRCEKAAMKIHT